MVNDQAVEPKKPNLALLLSPLWWLRGFLSAFLLTVLLDSITDLSSYEFLRAVHTLVIGWNSVASYLGSLVGNIPFIPTLPGSLITTVLVFPFFGYPVFHIVIEGGIKQIRKKIQDDEDAYVILSGLAQIAFFVFIVIQFFYYIFIILERGYQIFNDIGTVDVLALILNSLIVLIAFIFAMVRFPGFAISVATIVMFLGSFQLLYFIYSSSLFENTSIRTCQFYQRWDQLCPQLLKTIET